MPSRIKETAVCTYEISIAEGSANELDESVHESRETINNLLAGADSYNG